MERLQQSHPNNENPSPSPNNHKPIGGGGERVKRDEWSEGAVSSLLEAYESKWVLRNRAKLKGHDWEDVAKYVSSRANSTRSPKTQTQCKNKIESMKKRYRSESSSSAPDPSSSWPLYPRLHLLLRGTGTSSTTPPPPPPPQPPSVAAPPPPVPPVLVSAAAAAAASTLPPPPPPPPPLGVGVVGENNSHGSNGIDRGPKEDGIGSKMSDENVIVQTDSSTPALYSEKDNLKPKNMNKTTTRMEKRNKRRRREEWENIGESVRWLAEVVVRSEQARMETMKELEKMRAEAEAKRGEMDLKRTEIMANTQLEIARLFAGGIGKGGIDSSLRIGRSTN